MNKNKEHEKKELYESIIDEYINTSSCKSCPFFNIKDKVLICTNIVPTESTCIILRQYFN